MSSNDEADLLAEREREVLRLLLLGHDTKSIASELGLSLHVVNERLRTARRKLGVSSSRQAARLLATQEGAVPQFSGTKETGIGSRSPNASDATSTGVGHPQLWRIRGIVMIAVAVLLGALWVVSNPADAPAPVSKGPPKIIATSPAAGAVIRPGPFLLKITFDQPMMEGSYSFVQKSNETYPECGTTPVLSADGRTYSLKCRALPGRHYEVWLNSPPYMNFTGINGLPAQPHQLLFRAAKR